jgi:hypothetical protein
LALEFIETILEHTDKWTRAKLVRDSRDILNPLRFAERANKPSALNAGPS